MQETKEHIGRRVRSLRKEAREGQDDLVRLLGVEKASISRKERGSSNFTPHELILVAKHYGVSLDFLLTGEKPFEEDIPEQAHRMLRCFLCLNQEDRESMLNQCVDTILLDKYTKKP